MKKALSIVLVFAMLISLIPTVFAAEKNLMVYDNTRKYIFGTPAYGSEEATTATQNYWDAETDKSVSDQWNLVSRAGTNWNQFRNTANGANYHWNAYQYNSGGDIIVVFRIDIDEAGTYIPKLSYNEMTEGYIHDIYLVPDDGSITWTAEITKNRSAVLAYLEGKTPVATIDMWGETSGVKKTAVLDSYTAASAGKYLLVLRSNGYNEKMVPYQPDERTFIRAEINSFELIKDTGAEAVANGVLEYVTGLNALNNGVMFVHGINDSQTEGLRSTVLLQYWGYIDWKKTTTLIGTGSGRKTQGTAEEPYYTMDITKTDPYKLDTDLASDTLKLNMLHISSGFESAANGKGIFANIRYHDYCNTDGSLKNGRGRIAIRVNIPYAGKYKMELRGYKYYRGVVTDVRFAKATSDDRVTAEMSATLPIVGQYFGNAGTESLAVTDLTAKLVPLADTEYGNAIMVEATEAGEHWIVFDTSKRSQEANPKYVDYSNDYQAFSLTGIKLTPISYDVRESFAISANKTELTAGDTASVSASETMRDAGTRAAAVTYKSSSPSIATVDSDGKITAIAGGRALITAETSDGATDSFWVTVKDKEANKKIAYAITTSVDPNNMAIESGIRGDRISVTAEDIEGYTFRHWVRGSADNGSWISSDKTLSFSLMTNTYLTAVYTQEKGSKIVEFFNENGEYYAEAEADESGKVTLPENPTRTGFKFVKWLLSEDEEFTADTIVTKNITRTVARYEASGDTFATKLPDGSTENLSYGDKLELASVYTKGETSTPYSSYWYRDGKQVYYGTTYEYFAWDDTEITKSTAGVYIPVVVLDKTVKADNAYMIEYDACGKEIIEVGIIFGSGNHTVDSCDSKATSQNTAAHGQFTAKPGKTGGTVARGYLIYNDNGTYRVIYSD